MPLFDDTRLRHQHKRFDAAVSNACGLSRIGSERRLPESARRDGSFISGEERIRWSKRVCQELEQHLGYPARINPTKTFMVTITSLKGVVPIGDVPDFERIKAHYRSALRGLNCIAQIDAAYYAHVDPSRANVKLKTFVHYHVHGVAWGLSSAALNDWRSALRETGKLSPIMLGQSAIDVRTAHSFCGLVGYALKPPSYRCSIGCSDRVDAKGTVVRRDIQYKGSLRPNEVMTICRQLDGVRPDEMMIAAGEGVHLLKSAKRQHGAVRRAR